MGVRSIVSALASLALFACLAPAAQRPNGTPPPPPEPAAPQQEEKSTEQVELTANLVTVTLVVRDADGNLVTSLDPKDFAVFEDGAPQQIDRIAKTEQVPLRLALLFDASISVKERLEFEKRAAARFFGDVLGPKDQGSLYSVSTDWKQEQALTASPAALESALARLDADGITSLYGAIVGASAYLGSTEGRRVVVVLSDGYDTAGTTTLDQTLASAQRSDVVIFGISPAGTGGSVTPAARIGAGALRRLADETGGVAFFPTVERDRDREASQLDDIYRRVVEELRAQYVLTFYSDAPRDGRFHDLRVDLKRPGLTVTARKGYYAK